MYAIENSLGRFEADTEKEAKKLLRKAQKAAQVKQAADNANYQTAMMRARAEAYLIMARLHTNEKMPRGWRVRPIGVDKWAIETVYVDFHDEWIIRTENGRAQCSFHGSRPHSYVENGAGFCIAVIFAHAKTGQPLFYGVGVESDQLAIAEAHGITLESFERDAQPAESAA